MKKRLDLVSLWIAAGLMFSGAILGAELDAVDARSGSVTTSDFTFESSALQLSGLIDLPADGEVRALIILVHSYGESDVRNPQAFSAYSTLRQTFNDLGIATVLWDKPGQGQSEGVFDINQPVQSSAQEVVDAISHLRAQGIAGIDKIGLWGMSRAGWIAPIAISKDPEISFWISVSGTTIEDNFAYLLLSNLPHEGGTPEQAAQFAVEWREGCRILRTGGSYDRYQAATEALRSNRYISEMRGGWPSREAYLAFQETCEDDSCPDHDDDLCSYVPIAGFDSLLASLDIDVLALFGAKDLNIDWRKVRALYAATIGQNPDASLSTEVFADADHVINVAETGSIREMRSRTSAQKSEGFYDVQKAWLQRYVLVPDHDD